MANVNVNARLSSKRWQIVRGQLADSYIIPSEFIQRGIKFNVDFRNFDLSTILKITSPFK